MSDLAALNRSVSLSSGAADFIELSRIKLLAAKNQHSPATVARTRNSSVRVLDLIEKNAIAPMATTDAGAAGILQRLSEAFLQSLGLFSAFDTILNAGGFVNVPLRCRVFSVTLAGSAYQVAEADAKPISRMSLAANEIPIWKSVGIVVLTDELVRNISAAAANFIGDELRRSVGAATDSVFTELLIGSTGAPSVTSVGTTAANFLTDVGNALELISYGATSKLFLLVPPALNRRLITMRDNGGPIMVNGVVGSSIRVVASNALSDTAILLDSTQVAASTGDITVDQSGICASPHVMADNAAILALLRRDGFVQLASEIRRGKPISPKVRRQVAALCLGVGTHDQLGEVLEADGSISNNLDPQPSAPRRTRATVFDDE